MATAFTTTARAAERIAHAETSRLGVGLALASIGMLFTGLTSAYVVRQALDPAWRATPMPKILLINTAVLLASSVTLEKARRALGRVAAGSRFKWLTATLALGIAFVGGQFMAWQQLASGGINLSTNPHSSFFYLLTGLHGLHLLGGILALGYLCLRAWRDCRFMAAVPRVDPVRAIGATALYWHFMGGLWVYLLVLLFVRG